jgi:hypothetical protein
MNAEEDFQEQWIHMIETSDYEVAVPEPVFYPTYQRVNKLNHGWVGQDPGFVRGMMTRSSNKRLVAAVISSTAWL